MCFKEEQISIKSNELLMRLIVKIPTEIIGTVVCVYKIINEILVL